MSAILNDDKETGISLMLLDEEMDHGPILKQKEIFVEE
jgi:methionyl-tRNA formyltransferase